MKLIFPLVGFLGSISASLNSKTLRSFTESLKSGAVMREVHFRTLRKEITTVFGSAYTEDFYGEESDVEKKYENMKEAYFQSILCKTRSNFSSQKRIFKYGCLLFFKERVQEKKGSDSLRYLDMATHRLIAETLSEYTDRFFIGQSEVSDVINEDVENGAKDEAYYKKNVKKILSYYLRVLSRLSGGMRRRFVYFQMLKEDILLMLPNVPSDSKLSQDISDIFLKLEESAKTYLQEDDDASLRAFVGLSKDSISLLGDYKTNALKALREHHAIKIKNQSEIKKKEILSYNKREELKLIGLFDLVISTVSYCCVNSSIEILKSFSFDLLSYYMHKLIDYHFMDNLKEKIEKEPETIDDLVALDKVLSEVFWDAHRINNVFNFTIKDDDLFSVVKASKDPEPENGGLLGYLSNNPIGKIKDAALNAIPIFNSWRKSKTDFDAQDEKNRKERESAIKYINQKEDSFTTNDELTATHPHPGTREQRCYYTRHFKNEMKDRDIRIPSTNTIYLGNYVDEAQVSVMVECVEILEDVKLGSLKKLDRVSLNVKYNKLDSNIEYIRSILTDKGLAAAFRFLRLQVAHDFAVARFSDKKSGFEGFYRLVTAMTAKDGVYGGEYLELRKTELLWGFVAVTFFAVSVVLGYIIYNVSFKKSLRRRVRKEER